MELVVPAGQTLVTEGEPAHAFYELLEGAARVERGGRTVAVLGPGDFFGEVALLTRSPRTATVTTTAPSRVLVIDEDAFRERLGDAEFSSRVWAAAAGRLAVA